MEKKQDTNSYRSMLKGSSMMGGVQVFKIIVSLARGKFVALFLGPEGMGISSLFTTASNTISQISGLGTELAITKEVAQRLDDKSELHTMSAVSKGFRNIASVAGFIFCLIFSPLLSKITFGDYSYWWQFILLGFVVAAMVQNAGYTALLQGMQRIRAISVGTVAGSAVGLILGVPMYYFFGTKGIVPAMIVMTGVAALWLRREVDKAIPNPGIRFNFREHRGALKKLVAMGVVLISAPLLSSLCQYLLIVWIRISGSFDAVGLYSAANSITNQYAALVITAMSVDYFPRLAAVAADNKRLAIIVNRQTELVSFVIAPVVILVLIFAPLVVKILLTSEFESIVPLVRWMSVGVLLKATSFPLGYIAFAKDNRRLFFWMESVGCNILYILLGATGYYFFGVIGLGYAMVVEYVMVFLIYYFINRGIYQFRYSARSVQAIGVALISGVASLLLTLMTQSAMSYMLLGVCFIGTSAYSWLRLSALLKRNE